MIFGHCVPIPAEFGPGSSFGVLREFSYRRDDDTGGVCWCTDDCVDGCADVGPLATNFFYDSDFCGSLKEEIDLFSSALTFWSCFIYVSSKIGLLVDVALDGVCGTMLKWMGGWVVGGGVECRSS